MAHVTLVTKASVTNKGTLTHTHTTLAELFSSDTVLRDGRP